MKLKLFSLFAVLLLSGCSFYTPSKGKVIVQVRSDEAYYAGFFRACEILINREMEGIYIQAADNTAHFEFVDQCLQITQYMMDLNAASAYSQNWPGMTPLSLELQRRGFESVVMPH